MGVIVGIDLGTTNSCVALVKDGRPKVIEDERGYNILPSCIAMKGRGRFVVGHGAKALILTHPTETLYAVKRLIGRKFHSAEVQEAMKHVSYEVLEGEHGSVLLRMGDIELTPVEASSIILKAVKEIAERAIGEEVTDAVITVPANFTHAQRKATMEAGEKAGLNVLRLLNEPTAAALAYGFKKNINKRLAVFDLGGGTFDVSVLEVGEGVYEILGTAGNTFLGGEDFDYRIVNWLADHFTHMTGTDPRQDREALQRLKDAAERAKCELSFVDRTPILIPRLYGEHNLEVELSRDQLEGMVQDLVNEAIKITDQALRTAGLAIEDLDEIILVGGMTRMPKIQETIKVFFGMNPCKGVHPEEVVAVGAAVHGYSLESETQSTLLLDVTPMSLGVDTAGGFFKSVIERNSTVPATESRTFTTVKDGQGEVKIVVRQGESKLASENDLLGEFTLTGIREAEKMVPRIDVTFRIDTNGILAVNAVDRDTGEAQSIEIRDYIEQATGEETKAVSLARPELQSAAEANAETTQAANAEASKGLFGRLKKAMKRDKKAAKPEAAVGTGDSNSITMTHGIPDPTALAVRDGDLTGVASRDVDVNALAARSIDTDAVAERRGDDYAAAAADEFVGDPDPDEVFAAGGIDDDIAADLVHAVGASAASLPDAGGDTFADDVTSTAYGDPAALAEGDGWGGPDSHADAYAIAERRGATQFDHLGGAGSDLDLGGLGDDLAPATGAMGAIDADELDPYGVAPRGKGASAYDAGPLNIGSDLLDLDAGALSDLDGMDPFAVEPKRGGGTRKVAKPRDARPPEDRSQPAAPKAPKAPVAQAPATGGGGTVKVPSIPDAPKRKKKAAKLKISYKKAATFKKEYTRNVKRGGTFIKTPKPLEVGRSCVLQLGVPGFDTPLSLRGSVVWSSRDAELGPGQEEGMGIRFDPDDEAGVQSVKDVLARL